MNWQNIPRDDKTVKRAVVPKRGAFSFFDYGQIEPRLTAYFAAKIGHPEFAQQLRAGVDAYTAVAQLVTGKDEVTPEERQDWKRTYLSLLYGGGVKTIQLQFGNSAAEARKIIKTFHANWPAVRELQDRVLRQHQRRGYIVGLDGRHLHMEEFGEHKLLNKLIQGSAAGLMKQALLNIHRELRLERGLPVESRMVSVIHDEVILDGPVDELEWLHEAIPPLMVVREDVHEIVPIVVDHEVSTQTWADKVEYDEWLAATREEVAA
jgi:DNA polymerase-1